MKSDAEILADVRAVVESETYCPDHEEMDHLSCVACIQCRAIESYDESLLRVLDGEGIPWKEDE